LNPGNLKYSSTHEWVNAEGGIATLGITDYAQSELGEIVFVELPHVGSKFDKGDVFGTVESYKTVSDLVSPVSGEVVEINSALADSPQFINESPYEQGWTVKMKMTDPGELDALMTAEQYEGVLKGL
jgi:glycine cleavage system H protein